MYEEISLLIHSSIKISGSKIIYFDTYEMREDSHDADIIFITHDHFDHFSPQDIKKAAKENTLLIMPESIKGQEQQAGIRNVKFIRPNETLELEGLTVTAVPAYNPHKPFHTRDKNYVGYVVTMDNTVYYIAGDTDITPENQKIKCDAALIPIGGKYTMDYKEAAELVNIIKPKLAIPTHYGTVAGSLEDGKRFAELVDRGIEVRVLL